MKEIWNICPCRTIVGLIIQGLSRREERHRKQHHDSQRQNGSDLHFSTTDGIPTRILIEPMSLVIEKWQKK